MYIDLTQDEWLLICYALEKKIDILMDRATKLGNESDMAKAQQMQTLLERVQNLLSGPLPDTI